MLLTGLKKLTNASVAANPIWASVGQLPRSVRLRSADSHLGTASGKPTDPAGRSVKMSLVCPSGVFEESWISKAVVKSG